MNAQIIYFLLPHCELYVVIQGILYLSIHNIITEGLILKKITILLLSFILIISSCIPAFGEVEEDWTYYAFDGTQSEWAEPELQEALTNHLVYEEIMSKYTQNVTREEFCTLSVKLYEKFTRNEANVGIDPFDDTDNPYVLKAYNLGIVNGISDTAFAPSKSITRQEICVMIFRTLKASDFDTTIDMTLTFPFNDANMIADWALGKVIYCYHNDIIHGTSYKLLDPLSNTSREQAVVLINRTYLSFE